VFGAALKLPAGNPNTLFSQPLRALPWAATAATVAAVFLLVACEPRALGALGPWVSRAAPVSGAALLSLATACWQLPRAGGRPNAELVLAALGCAAGLVLLCTAAAITLARLDPYAVAHPDGWRAASPMAIAVLVPSVGAAITLGSLLPVAPNSNRMHRLALWLTAPTAWLAAAWMSTACIWLPEYVTPAQPFSAVQSGTDAHSWPVRLAVVAACAWASTGWLSVLAARQRRHMRRCGAVVALAVMAGVTANASWIAHLGPWALRGQIYANGVHVSDVVAHRRSPFLAAGQAETARHDLAVRMVQSQCAPCHGSAPGDLTARFSKRNLGEARELLETLREADRFGNPFLQRMPPLLGSDEEVDALAGWIVRH
jgi:hypothetical protein